MPRPVVTVNTRGFGNLERRVERAVRAGLEDAAERVVEDARRNVGSRSRSGEMARSIKASDVDREPGGWIVRVAVGAWYGRFQELGTRAKKGAAKTAKTKERRAAAGVGHAGVKPQRFLSRAARGVRGDALATAIRRRLR